MILGGIGAVDGTGRKNFFIVDSKTRASEIEAAFEGFCARKDIAIILITQT